MKKQRIALSVAPAPPAATHHEQDAREERKVRIKTGLRGGICITPMCW